MLKKQNKLMLGLICVMVCILLSGCSTVNFVREIDLKMTQLDRLDDRLYVIDIDTERDKFAAVLADMKIEAETMAELDPGLFKGKGLKEVKQKSNAIIELVEDMELQLQSKQLDKEELDGLMKQLTFEIEEVME